MNFKPETQRQKFRTRGQENILSNKSASNSSVTEIFICYCLQKYLILLIYWNHLLSIYLLCRRGITTNLLTFL